MEDFLTKLSRVEQCEVNALIMEHASDTAEQLTELECKLNGIECYTRGGLSEREQDHNKEPHFVNFENLIFLNV